ncbi:MAG TPA: serine hydrolase [Candidatus Krumholzibacteria bacterium]
MRLAAALLLVGWSALVAAAQTTNAQIERVENALRPLVSVQGREQQFTLVERMQHYRVPGVSIAVLARSQVVWARGYGMLVAGGSEPVRPDTPFQAGAVSEALSALGALRAVGAGEFTLETGVNSYLKSWKLPDTALTQGAPVTIGALLSHRSGLGVRSFPGYGPSESLPSLRDILDGTVLANTPAVRVIQTPGERFGYSGGGYVVLQQILVDVTDRSFDEWIRGSVLEPLGMTHSTFEQPLAVPLRSTAAHGHDSTGREVVGGWNAYPEQAAVGLWTTASDLARLVREIQWAVSGHSNGILSQSLAREMVTPQAGGDVGLGLFIDGEGAATRFAQSGASNGFRCELVGYVAGGYGAIVMANADSGRDLAREILAAIASTYAWPGFLAPAKVIASVPSAVLGAYTGAYELGPHRIIRIHVEQDHLVVTQPGTSPLQLWPESETAFFAQELTLSVIFEREQERVLGLRLLSESGEIMARRLP